MSMEEYNFYSSNCSTEPSKPFVQWNHVDGPMLCLSNDGLHWLTIWERFLLWTNNTTIEELNQKHINKKYGDNT